jgi:predicted DNA-binding protein
MEKLIPYTVHLPPELHRKLKRAARDRKAAGIVREALTAHLDGLDEYGAGFKAGIRKAKEEVNLHPLLNNLKWKDESMSEIVDNILENIDG